jgi:cation:H+ antiporter
MLINWIFIVVSLALLYLGAEGLVRGSASLALRLGLTPLVVGLTVVAMGTSMPEVMVSVKAALDGQGNLAVGNVLGSNIFNIGVILGCTAMVMPMKVQFQLIKIDTPVMLAVCLLVPVLLLDGVVSRIEGIFLLLGLGIYLVANVWLARKTASKEVEAEFQESMPSRTGSVFLDLVFIIAGLGVLVVGARFLTENSIAIARAYGISEAVIGLTIVAAGTSVPELAASIVAALKKEPDIALGNVVGSNIFNILAVLGAGACAAPMTAMDISSLDMWMMVGMSALLLPILWTGFKVTRFEGAILCAAYGGYVYLMWPK